MKTHPFLDQVLKPSSGLLALWLVAATPGQSATVWDGPVVTFAETSTDPTLPVNQDRMTDKVWITRGSVQGIFNAKTEASFNHYSSPADTEWANGTLADYASLSYSDWNSWARGVNPTPPSTVGVDAVVHLISDDIFVGIKFISWGGPGGLFSYQRTTPPVAVSPIPLAINQISNVVVLTWTDPVFSLQSATNVTGPYTTVTGVTSPYSNTISGAQLYFRLIH